MSKGVTAYQQTNHDDRILKPLIRDDASLKGTKEGFREASWNEAYDLIANKFRELQVKYGKDSLSVFSGVSMTNEKCYLTGNLHVWLLELATLIIMADFACRVQPGIPSFFWS